MEKITYNVSIEVGLVVSSSLMKRQVFLILYWGVQKLWGKGVVMLKVVCTSVTTLHW